MVEHIIWLVIGLARIVFDLLFVEILDWLIAQFRIERSEPQPHQVKKHVCIKPK